MEILGIGFSELVFIVIIILLVMGPKDMQKTGRMLGRWLNGIVTSDGWKVFQKTTHEIRTLPTKLMREANLENFDPGAPPPSPHLGGRTDPLSRSKPVTAPSAPKAPAENSIAPQQPQHTEAESDPPHNA